MMLLLIKVGIVVVSCVLLQTGHCQIVEGDMPTELIECTTLLGNKTGGSGYLHETSEDIYVHCLQQFLWKEGSIQWSDFNITERDKGFVKSLMRSFVRRGRSKRFSDTGGPGGPGRHGGPSIYPETGFRIRREYRRLSDRERMDFHMAINQMKATGQYDIFANMHRGIAIDSAHGGPNFLGWHRVYLSLLEEAIRRIKPWISLPYWDSTLDFEMANPVDSVIWTDSFLGNGNGFVISGPFANWMVADDPLTRNIGVDSDLISKENISKVLTRCRVRDISFPTAKDEFNLEIYHGGPHNWVGGQLSGLNTAAHDPVFFLLHAYVDYVWEVFRIRQATFCGVNPSTDYPPTAGQHSAERPMDRFPQYRNIDGYRNYWTQYWYRYERSPSCSMWQPYCGSPYLRCNLSRQRCVSVARTQTAPVDGGFGASAFAATEPSSVASETLARAQEATIDIGPRFIAPPAGPKTQAARLGLARTKRSVNQLVQKKITKQTNDTMLQKLGPQFQAPMSNGREADFQNGAFLGGVIGVQQDLAESKTFQFSDSMQLLPMPDYHEQSISNMLKPPIKNTFIINGHADVSQWVFIPVKVTYTSDRGNQASSFFQNKSLRNRSSSSNSNHAIPRARECVQDLSGAMQVRIQSSGLNYDGEYSDYALIDTHLPVDSATVYIGIKSPDAELTEVILSAVHSCGLMCQAHCFVPDSTPSFRQCPGVLKISNKDPSVYGRTYEEAVSRVWQGIVAGGGVRNENLRVVFDCSSIDKFPWLLNKDASIE